MASRNHLSRARPALASIRRHSIESHAAGVSR
jgi:hypothetical protein